MGMIEVIKMNALRNQLDRIEDLIIIYNRHGISNRVQALCERAENIQKEIDRLRKCERSDMEKKLLGGGE